MTWGCLRAPFGHLEYCTLLAVSGFRMNIYILPRACWYSSLPLSMVCNVATLPSENDVQQHETQTPLLQEPGYEAINIRNGFSAGWDDYRLWTWFWSIMFKPCFTMQFFKGYFFSVYVTGSAKNVQPVTKFLKLAYIFSYFLRKCFHFVAGCQFAT